MTRCALVTGATQGIGLAVATALAESNYNVVLHGIETQAIGVKLAQDLANAHGVRTAYVHADLTDLGATQNIVTAAENALAPIDILINNAGILHVSPVEHFSLERWQETLVINLTAAFLTIRSIIVGMRRRGYGRIINIASTVGLVGSPNIAAYVAAKHGLVGLSKCVALETATDGITVNCICPGSTDTSILRPLIDIRAAKLSGDRDAAIRELLLEKQPTGKLLSPAQIGALAVFLCTDAASGITGAAIPIDGGWTAR
jgi:3-hydroxybutyrate dehydrogenase